MTTEKTNNNMLFAVIALAFLLILTIGASSIALNNHAVSEKQKDAQIDSLQAELAWHQIQWNNLTDEEQR
jgi:uncharacterized membrane protein YjgN (DUF898 family)